MCGLPFLLLTPYVPSRSLSIPSYLIRTALASFYSAVPSNGMHRVQVMTDLEPGAIVALAKRVSKATWHASTTVDEEAFTAKAVRPVSHCRFPIDRPGLAWIMLLA